MPVDPSAVGAFAVAVLAIVVSPGPDTLLIVRYALGSGRRAGFAAVAGVQLGLLVHTLLAVLGLSVLIASSPMVFKGIAVAGAVYLAWLGIQGFRKDGRFSFEGGAPTAGAAQACRDAMLTNLLNPKVILLFLALYPNFLVVERGNTTRQLVTLSAVLIAINVAWQAPLAWAANAMRSRLAKPGAQRALSRVAGAILLGFAGWMLVEHLP